MTQDAPAAWRSSAEHPQVRLTDGGRSMRVDLLIAPLLEWLWCEGCSTAFSCQGDDRDWAHVTFADAASLEAAILALARAVSTAGDRELRFRMAQRSAPVREANGGEIHTVADYDNTLQWRITAWPQLWFMAGDDIADAGQADRLMHYQLEFPPSDLAKLTAAIYPGPHSAALREEPPSGGQPAS